MPFTLNSPKVRVTRSLGVLHDLFASMGMDSAKLSARIRQPGHDRTFRVSEAKFDDALRELLPESDWEVLDHPRDLAKIIDGRFGVIPEASIRLRENGRVFYFEVKKQGPAGNADERACKHHTVEFYKRLAAATRMPYHAFATIMCENLAEDDRYVIKHPYYFEADNYLLWKNYDLQILSDYLKMITERYIAAP